VVNNLRDISTDRKAGRRTLPVVFGYKGGEWEYLGMMCVAYLTPIIIWISGLSNFWILLPLLTLWIAGQKVLQIHKIPQGPAFNSLLADTALLGLIYSVFLALGIILGK
jgi:1,4-dihydroxy-2-naphthoate octaprenyltransferase